jgi:hypothetical protein
MTKYKNLIYPFGICAFALWLFITSNLPLSNSVAKADWLNENPNDLVSIRSNQRNHVFYENQPVNFRLVAPTAQTLSRYVVRDYRGEVVEQGTTTSNLALRVRQAGWYKLYLFGPRVREPWGDIVGGTNFVIFRDNPNFPKAPNAAIPLSNAVQSLGELKLTRLDANINFDWGNDSPAASLPPDGFFVRWTGLLSVPRSQTYTLYTLSDDGVRVWLDNKLLIDDWNEHGPTENRGEIVLDASKSYHIRVDYFEKAFGSTIKLTWESPDLPRQVVPSRYFAPDNKSTSHGLRGEYFVAPNTRAMAGDPAYYPSMDPVMRNVTGMGPQRHFVEDASKPDEAIAKLASAIEYDKKTYLAYDPLRQRKLMIAFPNGTDDAVGVRKVVARFKNDVKYWEPRNEPNGTVSGSHFAQNEMKRFYETVKSVDPTLKVLGPGTVTIGPNPHGLAWIEDFFKAGGAKYIDVFSFHAYNNVNGDVWLARNSLNQLNALFKKYGVENLEKWQTEQGYFAAMYGAYLPRHQGNWTMVQMMVYEQYGIPKEHNHYWYDKSHGFWDQPTWWQNDDGSLNPAAALMRVWSEELYGTRFVRSFNFGEPGNKLYLGNLFQGPGKTVAAFMSAGTPNGQVELKVTGATSLRVVSAFGVEQTVPVQAGKVLLTVPELPVYVQLQTGQTLDVVPTNWGRNLARSPGVVATAQGNPAHPKEANVPNDIAKITNGALENWYYRQVPRDQPWMSNVPRFPAWVELRLPARTSISRAVIYAAPPWQMQSTLLTYDLQYDDNGVWKTIERVREPTRTYKVWSPVLRTKVDSFFSDRWIFEHKFAPVTTQKIRLMVYDTTWGGGATKDVVDAGGQTGPHQITLREIELYAQ